MKQLFLLLISITIAEFGYAQSAFVCNVYKVQDQNGDKNDSSIFLISKKYFDKKMREIKEIVYGPGKGESCWTNSQYYNDGSIKKVLTKCSDGKVMNEVLYTYNRFGKNEKNRCEIIAKNIPFFEVIKTCYYGDSTIQKHYSDKQDFQKGIFDSKYVDIYGPIGKVSISYDIKAGGDTIKKTYLYLPLSDTLNGLSKLTGLKSSYEIVYTSPTGFMEITEYYDSSFNPGRTTKWFDSHHRLILEKYLNKVKDTVTSETKYEFGPDGKLRRKTINDFDGGITKIYNYNQGRIVREDYIYGEQLDHSILYKYSKIKQFVQYLGITIMGNVSHQLALKKC